MRKITIWIALAATLNELPTAHAATYTTPEEVRQQQEQAEREHTEQRLAAHVGKTYWIVPNLKASFSRRTAFFKEVPKDSTARLLGLGLGRGVFYPTEVSKFVVLDYITVEEHPDTPSLNQYYLRVRFEDGMEGFINISPHSPGPFYTSGPREDFEEYIYSENPADIDKRQARQRAEEKLAAKHAAQKRAARGGVHIGMSKDQVLRSSWGRPEAINRTTTAGHAREQWVYGLGNYLYFDNGILVAIQN